MRSSKNPWVFRAFIASLIGSIIPSSEDSELIEFFRLNFVFLAEKLDRVLIRGDPSLRKDPRLWRIILESELTRPPPWSRVKSTKKSSVTAGWGLWALLGYYLPWLSSFLRSKHSLMGSSIYFLPEPCLEGKSTVKSMKNFPFKGLCGSAECTGMYFFSASWRVIVE